MKEKFLFVKKVTDKGFWETVRTNLKYQFFIDELLKNYEIYCEGELKELPYRLFKQFFENGNRVDYENVYHGRRQAMNTCALLSVIYPDNEAYFERLQDILWATCNEYTWCLPAHLGLSKETGFYDEEGTKNEFNFIDLFASETGCALAEIKRILEDRLDDDIKERISNEIDRRIVKPYLENPVYFWENYPDNWAAVCSANVAMAFMYERPDLFPQIKDRVERAMGVFLSSYEDGGVCEEGVTYWEYGFGFYVTYAQMLYEWTNGKEDWFVKEKVKNIAAYSKLVFLSDGYSVTFSDSSRTKNPVSFGIMEMLRAYYGEAMPVLDFDNYYIYNRWARWQTHIRSIAFFDPDMEYKAKNMENTIFVKDAGMFVRRGPIYDLAVSAGHNDAPHNHNDLGSFIVQSGGERVLVDLGVGEYTRAYFALLSRYDHLVCGSQGHSVPIINGTHQAPGREHRGEMDYADGVVSIDLTKAYELPELKKFERTFTLQDDCFVLCDDFAFAGEGTVKERFITKTKPEITAEGVKIGDAVLVCNEEWEPMVTTETYRSRRREDVTAYLIDFVPKEQNKTHFEMTVQF